MPNAMQGPLRVGIVAALLAVSIGGIMVLANQPSNANFDATKPEATTPKATATTATPASTTAATPQAALETAGNTVASPDLRRVNPADYLDPPELGTQAPDFTTTSVQGTPVHLKHYAGKKNLVLVFYQGSFCSVCAHQLADLQSHYSEFKAASTEIIAISADDRQHALQTLVNQGVSFPIIPDHDKTLIQQFGVANISRQNIAWPSVIIIDKQGVVRMSFADPTGKRLHSADILPVLAKING